MTTSTTPSSLSTTMTTITATSNKSVTVSSPGKVLFVGGYLILEEENVGLVFGIDKRFYVTCDSTWCEQQCDNNIIDIHISSPQLNHMKWYYQYNIKSNTFISILQDDDNNKNPFLEKTIQLSLMYLLNHRNQHKQQQYLHSLSFIIKGDNDFYSLIPHLLIKDDNNDNNLDMLLTLHNAENLKPFLPAKQNPMTKQYYKTGLGSSACLVTSIISSLVYTILGTNNNTTNTNNENDDNNKQQKQQDRIQIIYNLSQLCHCYAQGKIGSGFDISASCYGTHIYQRFSQVIIYDFLHNQLQKQHDNNNNDLNNNINIVSSLQHIIDSNWIHGSSNNNTTTIPQSVTLNIQCTKLIQIIMADISCGSESPSMARHVMEWKKQQQQLVEQKLIKKIPHWDDLILYNQKVITLFQKLSYILNDISNDNDEMINSIKDVLIQKNIKDWGNNEKRSTYDDSINNNVDNNDLNHYVLIMSNILYDIYNTYQIIRYHLKTMGDECCNVSIEPNIQSYIIDNTIQSIPGVITAFVPGAGGYDSLVCLYINHDTIRYQIANLWSSFNNNNYNNNNNIGTDNNGTDNNGTDNNGTDNNGTDNTNDNSRTSLSIRIKQHMKTNDMKICPLTCRAVDYGEAIRIESITSSSSTL